MPVPTLITDLSTTAASNSPAGTDAIGNSLDDYLRAIQRIVRLRDAIASATIASATTVDLSTVAEAMVTVTGSVTITSLGTVSAGVEKVLRFAAAPQLTHSANLILPNATNITAQADAIATFRSLGSGAWILTSYSVISSTPGANSITTAMLQDNSVTYAKIQDVSATDKVLGRSSSGAGDVEEIPCTAAGRALLAGASAAAQATTLSLGTASNAAFNSITNQSGKKLGKITLSTSAASGGSDGDLWLRY